MGILRTRLWVRSLSVTTSSAHEKFGFGLERGGILILRLGWFSGSWWPNQWANSGRLLHEALPEH